MKKLLLTLTLVFTLSATSNAETIVLVGDAWPPYNNHSEDLQKGYVVDIAEAIFSRHGHQVEYKLMPWKVAVEETRRGTYDGLIGVDKEEGVGFIFPEEEVGTYQIAFFVKKGNPWRFTNTQSLGQVRLGVAEGYSYSPWLNEYIETYKKDYKRIQAISGSAPLTTNLNKLMADRVDAVIASTSTMYYAALKLGLFGQVQYAGSGGSGGHVYLAFSPAVKNSQTYADLFNQGILELRASGELEDILGHYGLSDWK